MKQMSVVKTVNTCGIMRGYGMSVSPLKSGNPSILGYQGLLNRERGCAIQRIGYHQS